MRAGRRGTSDTGAFSSQVAISHGVTVTARHAEPRLREALLDTRIVAIVEPRQSGKTNVARRIADPDRPFLSLDNAKAARVLALPMHPYLTPEIQDPIIAAVRAFNG